MSTDTFRDLILQQLAFRLAGSARPVSTIALDGISASDIPERTLAKVTELIL